jgi:iron complex transport system ATP-binding protein
MIKVEKLNFTYNHAPFIQDLSHQFDTGKISTVIGPNGCGKSTLVKLITRQLRPQSGSVLLNNQDIRQLKSREFARCVALLSQNTFVPNMEIEQLVLSGRYPHQSFASSNSAEDRRIVQAALQQTGADKFRQKNVRNLSGGERQKVFISMALAQDTDIIVLDEPTAFLDIHACNDIMQLIKKLNDDLGKTIIMVLHDLQFALHYSDDLLVMQNGSIIQSGSATEVIASGAIEQAFKIKIKCFTEDDNPYYCFTT